MSDKVPDEMNNFSTSSKYFLFRSAILAYFGSNLQIQISMVRY